MINSRTKNAKFNIIIGYIAQIGIILLSFIGRKIFLKFLSTEYLGLNGLYSNILSVLSIGELGIDMAACFSLYKPIADNDKALIHSLLDFFKKIYITISLIILIIGLAIIPLLKYLINSDLNQSDLIIFYVLFLLNSILTYFVAHKIVLFSALQEQRFVKTVNLLSNLILQILHIIVLILWKNFYIYIVTTLISTLISNIIINYISNKKHKDILIDQEKVDFERKVIIKSIKSCFLYKIGAVLVTSTDNILISILVSTKAVGIYSNYYQVFSAVQGFIAIITMSLISGIGSLAANNMKKKQEELFDSLVLFYNFVATVILVGFSLLINNLIELWLGSEYLFDTKTVLMISLVFYITNIVTPVWMLRDANGMFEEVKYILLIRAFLNLILSVLFGLLWGTLGIFLATIISLLLTNFWLEPKIVSKKILNRNQSKYWSHQLYYFGLTILVYFLCCIAIKNIGTSLIYLICKSIIVILITMIIYMIFNIKSKSLNNIIKYIKQLI